MTDRKKEETALFRFGVIFPLLDANLPKGGLGQRIREIARKNYEIPYSSRVRISEGTVRNWYYRYIKTRNIESLLPRSRKDKGQSRTVDFEAANELIRRKKQNPDVPLTTLVKMIGEEDGMSLRLHSAYRLIANWNRSNLNPEERNQRRFEMESCNDCWMLDAMSGPKGDKIRLILDNLRVHTAKAVVEYLSTVEGRFGFVFTPKHASWLNLVESFFSKMTRQMLKGIRVKSKEELVRRIYNYFDEINAEPVVFRWTWHLDDIDPTEEVKTETLLEMSS